MLAGSTNLPIGSALKCGEVRIHCFDFPIAEDVGLQLDAVSVGIGVIERQRHAVMHRDMRLEAVIVVELPLGIQQVVDRIVLEGEMVHADGPANSALTLFSVVSRAREVGRAMPTRIGRGGAAQTEPMMMMMMAASPGRGAGGRAQRATGSSTTKLTESRFPGAHAHARATPTRQLASMTSS